LGGHYTWRITAKRLEYSFQPGISGESQNDQVYDDTFAGLLSTNITQDPFVEGVPSLYIENISEAQFFDELGNYIADANDGVDGGTVNSDSDNGGDF
jgi:hypothetical protein